MQCPCLQLQQLSSFISNFVSSSCLHHFVISQFVGILSLPLLPSSSIYPHSSIFLIILISLCPPPLMNALAATSASSVAMNCDLAKAEGCFGQLFDQLPICSANEANAGELSFRCQHFNVLDICFGHNQIRCLPAAIGTAARMAYQKRVDQCLFANKMAMQEQTDEHEHPQHQAHQQQQRMRTMMMMNGPSSSLPPASLLASPSELQFISLFGYLQTQCRPRRRSPEGTAERGGSGTRRSHHHQHNQHQQQQHSSTTNHNNNGPNGVGGGWANCSAAYLEEVMGLCEGEMGKRQHPAHMQLERHRLLKMKLDASSKLLHFPETRPEDECLMVRSVLSDIFLVHQKFCFHTTVTRCLCERLHFERTCGIECANLEAFGLPLNQQLLWTDFRGRLSSGNHFCPSPPFLLMALLTAFLMGCPTAIANANAARIR